MNNVVQEVEAAHLHIHIEGLGSDGVGTEQSFYVMSFFNLVRDQILNDSRRPSKQIESVLHFIKGTSGIRTGFGLRKYARSYLPLYLGALLRQSFLRSARSPKGQLRAIESDRRNALMAKQVISK